MLRLMGVSGKMPAAIYTMLLCSGITLAASLSSAEEVSVLTGRFVAQIPGPWLTSFGPNRESYIFEMTSASRSQFVILSYTFLLYEPVLPDVFDYSRLYTFKAERNEQCCDSIEEVSKRYVFDEQGTFLGVKYEIDYAKNAPPLNVSWKTRLPCYLLDWETVTLIH